MKRLISVICALILVITPSIVLADSSSTKKLDAKAFIGMTEQALVASYGNPTRKEPSEYGFTWYVYSKDYKSFFMAGVQDGKVVGFYTNAKTLSYGTTIKLNSTKATVRSILGKPITYICSNGNVCMLSDVDQKDIFPNGDNYIIVFYDTVSGKGVTSILIVSKAAEITSEVNHPALSDDQVAAYQRISVDLINAIRVRNGQCVLTTDYMDSKLAKSRSTDMRNRNYFSHYTPAPNRLSPFQQATKMGIKYKSMGENIIYGDQNAIIAHEAFMNSQGHRSNILSSKYKKMGAGVAYGGSRYVILTNIFQN
jgi:uncharacterized protein YkwD